MPEMRDVIQHIKEADNLFPGADDAELKDRRKGMKMYRYSFRVWIGGVGSDEDAAWEDAIENFCQDSGNPGDWMMITRQELDLDSYDEIGDEEIISKGQED